MRTGLLLVLAALIPSACGESQADVQPPRAPEPVAVTVAQVEAGSLPRIVRATGTLAPDEQVVVAAEATGRLVAVLRDVGDRVAPGDALARVDETDYALARDRERRAVEESLARLGLEALPEGDVDLESLPAVERARLEAANTKARFERMQALRRRPQPLVSEQEFTDARSAWEVSTSAHRHALLTARAQLAEVHTRRALLDAAEDRLRRTAHVVPSGERPGSAAVASGPATGAESPTYVVVERHVATGDWVGIGDPLYRLLDDDPMRLRVAVPERRLAAIAVGQTARIEVTAAADPIEGTVVRIRPEVDPSTRTGQVEIAIANAERRLAAGAFAVAEIEVGADEGVPLVRASSVRTFAGVRKVVVEKAGKAVEKVVTVGRRSGDFLEVTSGLAVGDAYVVDPPASLAAGAPLRVAGEAADQGTRR